MAGYATLGEGPWKERVSFLAKEALPYQYRMLDNAVEGAPESNAIENYRIAAGLSKGEHRGMLFQDSDVTKWLEAAAYSLHTCPDGAVRARIDGLISLIGQAMAPDGYLDTYYQCNGLERFTNIAHGHELYCMGHLMEAAVAHYEETGEQSLLALARRCADLLCDTIGGGKGQKDVYPGHPEIEAALFRLSQATGERRYAALAERMLNQRGAQPSFLLADDGYQKLYTGHWYDLTYHQAHRPVREQHTAEGHAVRAVYLYRAMAMLAARTKDGALQSALNDLWVNVCGRRMYVTGGIGSEAHGERFSNDFDLPGDRAYAETCASVGMFLWAREMLALGEDGRYADMMEWELYNNISAGISQDGQRYFYVNPLSVTPRDAAWRFDQSHVESERVSWFACACCPTNVLRLLFSLYRYIFRETEGGLAVDLYVSAVWNNGGLPQWRLTADGVPCQKAELRYLGRSPAEACVRLRIPRWCRSFELRVNGEAVPYEERNGYACLQRLWREGDRVEIRMEARPCFLYADPRVEAAAGKVCLAWGPVLYCFESCDNGAELVCLRVNPEAEIRRKPFAVGRERITALEGEGVRLTPGGALYADRPPEAVTAGWRAVPYALWGNRGGGEMRVWMQEALRAPV